ncbi:MAG: hypothetical protein Q7S89_02460, partial [bacterium]|nr:hypothetical protein [bacterium]
MTTFDTWLEEVRRIQTLYRIGDLVEWDTKVNLPPGAHGIRAEESGILKGLHHGRLTDPHFAGETETLLGDTGLTPEQQVCVRAMHWNISRARRVPQDLVTELGRVVGAAHEPWVDAKKNNTFATFAPHLEQIVKLKRREAEALKIGEAHLYDGLLDEFDRGTTTAELLRILDEHATGVKPLLDRVLGATPPDTSILALPFDEATTTDFAKGVIRRMGYDFDRGRLDRTTHPSSYGCSATDVRICTFTEWHGFRMTLSAIMHEAGHAVYDQGYDPAWWHTPMAEPISIGVHESQSSIWEIFIGQSPAFWKFYFHILQDRFPFLAKRSRDEMFKAINR